MYVKRIATESIQRALSLFPAVSIVGPRQCGKTTLAKTFSQTYYDLESIEDQNRLMFQFDDLVEKDNLIILDEAQEFPEIFKKLRVVIDQNREKIGRFLILGSVSPSTMKLVSESLAGRLHVIELSPLNLTELSPDSIESLWLYGGFPNGGILNKETFPIWQKSYIDLLIKRDLPLWGLPSKPQTTLRLLKMIGGSIGNLVNFSQLGNSMGLSHTAIHNYMEYLEGSFLVFQLQPYFVNISKRLVKTPKIFFHDTGILHTLLDTYSYEKLTCLPWLGNSWENFVIKQIISSFRQREYAFSPYFFRTSDGHEVDLLIESEFLSCIEIKTSNTINDSDIQKLQKIATAIGAKKCIFIYRGHTVLEKENLLITPISDFLRRIDYCFKV